MKRETRDLDIAVPDALTALGPAYVQALLAVAMVSTVYQPEHIRRYSAITVGSDLMRQVDVALARHFGL